MPRTQFQKLFFAFVTVVITVHAYVYYSLYVIHGNTFIANTGASGVLEAINEMGGVPVMGYNIPIWAVVLIEFALAYILEIFVGSPQSFKIACHYFNPQKNHPMIFETMIISATVLVMCPIMSFIAAILYYPYNFIEFNVLHFLAEWLKLVCYNFPFAFFSQLFFIQPIVRTIFKRVFRKDIEKRKELAAEKEKKGETLMPHSESEAIEDLLKRMEEIQIELKEMEEKKKTFIS